MHGNKSQNARQNALSNFKSGKTRILVVKSRIIKVIFREENSFSLKKTYATNPRINYL
nr:hypothetical protein [Chryseobacterium sp. MDT2-18]